MGIQEVDREREREWNAKIESFVIVVIVKEFIIFLSTWKIILAIITCVVICAKNRFFFIFASPNRLSQQFGTFFSFFYWQHLFPVFLFLSRSLWLSLFCSISISIHRHFAYGSVCLYYAIGEPHKMEWFVVCKRPYNKNQFSVQKKKGETTNIVWKTEQKTWNWV